MTPPGQSARFIDFEVDISHIETEDDEPLDNMYTGCLARLLAESLKSSWEGPPRKPGQDSRPFVVAANVGVFSALHAPPIVPDLFVALDVAMPPELFEKPHRTYFVWEYGKPPDVVLEVVSNNKGEELTRKLDEYERMRVPYYVVFDPEHLLGAGERNVYAFRLEGTTYEAILRPVFERIGLSLVEWHGSHEGVETLWLRWRDSHGRMIPTGAERAAAAEAEREKAEAEREKAEAEREKAEAEREKAQGRARKLAERLKQLGVDPDE